MRLDALALLALFLLPLPACATNSKTSTRQTAEASTPQSSDVTKQPAALADDWGLFQVRDGVAGGYVNQAVDDDGVKKASAYALNVLQNRDGGTRASL